MKEIIQLGQIIRAERKQQGLSQEALVAKYGGSRFTLGRIEAGTEDNLSLAIAIKALNALGLKLVIKRP